MFFGLDDTPNRATWAQPLPQLAFASSASHGGYSVSEVRLFAVQMLSLDF